MFNFDCHLRCFSLALYLIIFLLKANVSAALPEFISQIRSGSGSRIVGSGGVSSGALKLEQDWHGDVCEFQLKNSGDSPVRVHEIVLADVEHGLPGATPIYAEGFQMLSQTAGTLAEPQDVGGYTDRSHYRLPEPPGFRTVYGMLMLSPPGSDRVLLGFTSCLRFSGKFHLNKDHLQIVVDTEDLELSPGQSWRLEELLIQTKAGRATLLDDLAAAIEANHPHLRHEPVPTGWCSWYCFGPGVTAKNITDNLDWIGKNIPSLRYIQIDDGYQPWMGDWLETGKAFGGGVQGVLRKIRERGFEPAIWVAPFIASDKVSSSSMAW